MLEAYEAQQPDYEEEYEEDGDEWDGTDQRQGKKSNNLPFWGNQNTMNLNPLILTNIQNSPYFKVNLIELKTYHEVKSANWIDTVFVSTTSTSLGY